jgi:hypothetical protein
MASVSNCATPAVVCDAASLAAERGSSNKAYANDDTGGGAMVWGMSLPSSFGEFWPDGDFEGETESGTPGWRVRLKSYYEAQSPEEQRRLFNYEGAQESAAHYYPGQVSAKFISEIGTRRGGGMPPLTPIEPHEPPRFFQTCKTYASLGSLIMLNSRIIAVDDALKDIVERMEPGVHRFFPIEIRMPNGAIFPKQYHTLVIGQYFDSFLPERSKAGSWRKDGDYAIKLGDRKSDMAGLAFSSAVFGKAHLWRERRPREWLTLFSDGLQAAIEDAGLCTPKLNKMKGI